MKIIILNNSIIAAAIASNILTSISMSYIAIVLIVIADTCWVLHPVAWPMHLQRDGLLSPIWPRDAQELLLLFDDGGT